MEPYLPEKIPFPPDVQEAIDVASEISRTIASLPKHVQQKASQFFRGIKTRSRAISSTIGKTGKVSSAQRSALNNMLAAVRKWQRDE